MQSKPTIDNHREISAALDFLRQASADDGAFELDPRVVSGWVEMCLGALEVLVTAKRGKHADDKALRQTVEEHLDHASGHAAAAYNASHGDNMDSWTWCSAADDDGLMHFDHATARIALLYARKAIVEQEAESDRALAQKIKEGANGLMQTTEGIVGIATELYVRRAYPNSCKVDKLEHGARCGVNWFLYDSSEPAVSVHPTRPVETDNKPGKADTKCVTPITHWSVYVDGVKVTDVTDVKCEHGDGIPGMDKMPGFVSETTFGTKPIGIAMNGARRGELVGVATGDTLRRTAVLSKIREYAKRDVDRFIGAGYIDAEGLNNSPVSCVLCHGCSYAKWPNKGPGYSERCDKCKLDPNRPGYAGK